MELSAILSDFADEAEEELTGGDRFAIAFAMADFWHNGQTRKFKDGPYLDHPVDAYRIIDEAYDELERRVGEEDLTDIRCATLLHDVTEEIMRRTSSAFVREREHREEMIGHYLGPGVLRLVRCLSEHSRYASRDRKESWLERKRANVEQVAHADLKLRIASIADKLANIRELLDDFGERGESLWKECGRRPGDYIYYHSALLSAYASGPFSIAGLAVYTDYAEALEEFRLAVLPRRGSTKALEAYPT